MLEPKSAILGTVGRVEAAVFDVDWRLGGGAAGGPVFDAGGRPIGIALPDEEREDSRRRDSQAVVLGNACSVVATAEKRIAGATPPPATRLRVEDARAVTQARKPADPKAPRMTIPMVSSSNFDLSLMTPAMADSDVGRSNPRTDFGPWTRYVNIAPSVLLVRVSPQFEESLWKTIARGAAATQGANLPPLKSFSSNFLRMRAFCGAAEVAPHSPFHHRARSAGPCGHPRRALCVRGRRLRPALRNGPLRSLFGEVAGPGRHHHRRSQAVRSDLSRSPVAREPTSASLL